jgi:hypothetical protein
MSKRIYASSPAVVLIGNRVEVVANIHAGLASVIGRSVAIPVSDQEALTLACSLLGRLPLDWVEHTADLTRLWKLVKVFEEAKQKTEGKSDG